MTDKKHEGYLENPFRVDGVEERVYKKGGRVKEFTDNDTGELKTYQELSKIESRLNDSKRYTKLFHESAELLRALTPSAKSLFLFVATRLVVQRDSIFLNSPDVCEWCGFSRSVFFTAILELQDKRILAKKLGSHMEFWINPNIFYNGNRLKLFAYNKQIFIKEDRLKAIGNKFDTNEKDAGE